MTPHDMNITRLAHTAGSAVCSVYASSFPGYAS